MTTKEDWEFRQKYFRERAAWFRQEAYRMECEAAEFDALADRAEQQGALDGPSSGPS